MMPGGNMTGPDGRHRMYGVARPGMRMLSALAPTPTPRPVTRRMRGEVPLQQLKRELNAGSRFFWAGRGVKSD